MSELKTGNRVFARVALTSVVASVMPFAHAQSVSSARAGLIDLTDGAVYVNDVLSTLSTGGTLQLQNGERVRTDRGKVEMVMGPNMVLWLGGASALTLIDTRLSEAVAQLEGGSAIVEITEELEGIRMSMRVGESVTVLTRPGVYRFNAGEPRLRVYGGQAEVRIGVKQATVKRDREIRLTEGLRQDKLDRKKEMDEAFLWPAQRSFEVFKPVWRAARGKNWHITLSGTAVNDAFGAEVSDADIMSELYRDAVEKRQLEQSAEQIQQRQREKAEADRRKQEADRKRQEEEDRKKAREQGPVKQQ